MSNNEDLRSDIKILAEGLLLVQECVSRLVMRIGVKELQHYHEARETEKQMFELARKLQNIINKDQ